MFNRNIRNKQQFKALLMKFGIRCTGSNLRESHNTTLVVYIPKSEFSEDAQSLVEDATTEFFQCEVEKSRVVEQTESIAVQMLLAL